MAETTDRSGPKSDNEITELNARLFNAIRKGNLQKVQSLLSHGVQTNIVDKNNKHNTPLHYAVEKTKKDIIEELLQPQWKTDINVKNSEGNTPLQIAVLLLNREIETLLLSYQTEIRKENVGITTEQSFISETFKRTTGAAGIEGQFYEINLLTWLLLRGTTDPEILRFYLASNMEEADKFDDIVFTCQYKTGKKTKTVFLQAKHKTDGKKITLESLLSNSESGDFSLLKYFISYRKIKRLFLKGDGPIFSSNFDNSEFVIYSNAPFSDVGKSCLKLEDMDENDFLRLGKNQNIRFQFDSDKRDRFVGLLGSTSDCRRLAKELVEGIKSGNGIDVKKDIFQTYYHALRGKVIEKTKDNLKGKLANRFINKENLTSDEGEFRKVFFEEAIKVFKKQGIGLKQELENKFWKLSKKTDNQKITQLPNDDPIEENEIREFLNKFKLISDQPGEKDLEKIIKSEIGKVFAVDEQDIDSVFSDVVIRVKKWWQNDDKYLTNYNKIFEEATRFSIQFDVQEPVVAFTGRTKQLKNLHKSLQNCQTAVISQIASITGLGGVGKSELARKYLYEYKKYYDNNIIWINAASDTTISESFCKLAEEKLKIRTGDQNSRDRNIVDVVYDVYNFFAKRYRKSLFVFDNAENEECDSKGIHQVLPKFVLNVKPYVIITSRDKNWTGVEILQLDVFSKQEALEFIKTALLYQEDERELQKLSEKLQQFPLALKQAVAYINQENFKFQMRGYEKFRIENYLNEFKENAQKLLNHQGRNVISDGYTATVMTTWQITIDRIKKKGFALRILQIMAYFAPDGIHVSIFSKLITDEEERNNAVELLDQYSLVELKNGVINIHRLVQTVTRISLEESGENQEILKQVYELIGATYFSDCYFFPYLPPIIMTHLEAVLSHIDDWLRKNPADSRQIEKEYLVVLLNWMTRETFNLQRKKELLQRVLQIYEKNCFERLEIAKQLSLLSTTYFQMDDNENAKELQERALIIYEKEYGPHDVRYAEELLKTSNDYRHMNDRGKARYLLDKALPIYETEYGLDRLKLAGSFAEIGSMYSSVGEHLKAKALLKRAVDIYESFHGCENFDLSEKLFQLHFQYSNMDDRKNVVKLLELSIQIHENKDDSSSFHLGEKIEKLFSEYNALLDYEKSKKLLGQALIAFEKYYNHNYVDLAGKLREISSKYRYIGHRKTSKMLLERALAIYENEYNPESTVFAKQLLEMSSGFCALQDYEKAKNLLERCLAINENVLGPENLKFPAQLSQISTKYRHIDCKKAKQLLERALQIYETIYDHDDLRFAEGLFDISCEYSSLRDHEKAIQLLERVLPSFEKHLDVNDIIFAQKLSQISSEYGYIGDRVKAKEFLNRALTIYEGKNYGLQNVGFTDTLLELSSAFIELLEYEKAKQLLELAVPIYEEFSGSSRLLFARKLSKISSLFKNVGESERERELLERVLQIYIEDYGPDHVNLAWILRNLGHSGKGEKFLKRALEIQESYYGSHHFEVAITLFYLSNYSTSSNAQKLHDRSVLILKIFKLFHLTEVDKLSLLYQNLQTLHSTISAGNLAWVKTLINAGFNVLQRNHLDTVVHQAVAGEKVDVLGLILKEIRKKYPHLLSDALDAMDSKGETPLMWTVKKGKINHGRMLLESGANPNIQDQVGMTALHWAALNGSYEFIRILLCKQADSSIKDNNGKTALDLAEEKLSQDPDNYYLKRITSVFSHSHKCVERSVFLYCLTLTLVFISVVLFLSTKLN